MGNQAQQLLQGIQFFRLPTVVSEAAATVTDISTVPEVELPDTSINSLLDPSPASEQSANTDNLGFVAPAIALAAATFGISQLGGKDSAANESSLDDFDLATSSQDDIDLIDLNIDLDDEEYLLEESLPEENFDEFIENPKIPATLNSEFEQPLDATLTSDSLSAEQEIADAFMSIDETIDYSQNQNIAESLESTDISDMEQSLLDDLKQEVYEEYTLDDNLNNDEYPINFEDDLSAYSVPNLKDPMEGVNELAIGEASIDPMIVSATSSFEDDTAFGATPSLLDEDANVNLPTSVDFSIPDFDDDFQIPEIDIESTLDNSNSFFDSSTSTQEFRTDTTSDFDPFAMDDFTVTESNNTEIMDDVFASNPLLESPDEQVSGEFDFVADDYDSNELLEDSLETPSEEAFSSAFDMSFDESPFDTTFDQTVNDSLDAPFDDNSNDLPQLVIEEELTNVPAQIPDIYFETSEDAGLSEEYTFEQEESPLMVTDDLVESDNFFDSMLIPENEIFGEELVEVVNDQGNDGLILDDEIDSAFQFQSSSTDLLESQSTEPQSTEFSFDINESLPVDYLDLAESDSYVDNLSDDFLPENEEFILNPSDPSDQLDVFPNIQGDENLVAESQFQEASISDLSVEEQVESDISSLFDESITESINPPSDAFDDLDSISETNFPSLFDTSEEDILETETNNLDDLIWDSEAIASDLSDIAEDLPSSATNDLSETTNSIDDSSFDLPDFSQMPDDEVFGFDMSDDNFTDLPNSVEEVPVDSVEGLLHESELDVSSIFDDILEEEVDFDYNEFLNNSADDNILDIPEDESDFSALTEESVIFNTAPNDLDMEIFADSSAFSLPEPIDLGLESELTKPNPDPSVDFSNNWFEEITGDEDLDNFPDLEDLSVGYPSLENESLDISDDTSYGFADNLLDSLMDESDEEFEDLSVDVLSSSDLPTVSNLLPNPNIDEPNDEILKAEDDDSEFDFSAFDTQTDDSIITARAEIDDFLSGTVGIGKLSDENSKPKKNISSEPSNDHT